MPNQDISYVILCKLYIYAQTRIAVKHSLIYICISDVRNEALESTGAETDFF